MRKPILIVTALIFIFTVVVFAVSLLDKGVERKKSKTVNLYVYVGGCIESEKWFVLQDEITTYNQLFERAGVPEYADLSFFDKHDIISSADFIIGEGGNFYKIIILKNSLMPVMINLNECEISDLINIGIENESAKNIIDYRRQKGAIKNKSELLSENLLTIKEYSSVLFLIYSVYDEYDVM